MDSKQSSEAEGQNGNGEGEPPTKLAKLDQPIKQEAKDELDNNGLTEFKTEAEDRKPGTDERSRHCPYLDTIDRNRLDFDFEKLCSGRGKGTHAHTHSMAMGHYVFLNLETHKFYCLPDDYEFVHPSLQDIIYLANPTYSRVYIARMDSDTRMVRAHDGNPYYPGIVGLNNLKASDYCSVIIHILSRATPLRNYFLREQNYIGLPRPPGDRASLLVRRFGELLRKLWNPRNFKAHVSPHEFLQAVVLCSKKRFQFTVQSDAVDFMSWLLNTLHMGLNGTKSVSSSIVNKTFRGKMRIYSHKVIPVELTEEQRLLLAHTDEYTEKVEESHFLFLTCDLPPPPLYPDEMKEKLIPQVPLSSILSKFNGVAKKEYKTHKDSTMKRFQLIKLPQYILLYVKRFVKNLFTREKNPTIVNFPVRGVDFGDLLDPWTRAKHQFTTYNLVANVVHDGTPVSGTYRVHLQHSSTEKWFELQDLHVDEILPQMIPLSETLVQVWQVDTSVPNPNYGKPPPMPEEPTALSESVGAATSAASSSTDAEMMPPPPPPPPPPTASSE
uniref:ubiquitinyl hydrolase 1 n=1 Tax=Macrostomum lignano TaxID=282301 RepID=A0A1I8G0W6_9PLAT